MFYFTAFLNSLYNLSWLRSQKNNSTQAINYIVLFVIILSAIYAGYSSYIVPSMLHEMSDKIFTQAPDFKAQFIDGKLHVDNVEQPYIFEGEDETGNFKIFLDTISTSSIDIEDVHEDDDVHTILITSEKMVVHASGAGKTTIKSFADINGLSFTKKDIKTVVDSFLNNTALIFIFFLIFWFVAFAFGRVVYVLFLSLLVYVVAKFFKLGIWKFSHVYTVGLFALTLPSIIVALLAFVNVYTPYLFSVLTLVIMSGVVFVGKDEPSNQTPIQAEHTDTSS